MRAARRQVHPARRGHRPRALHRRGRAGDPRRHALARPRRRRRAVLPDAALRPLSRGHRSSCSRPATPIAATARRKSSRQMRDAADARARRSRATTAAAAIARDAARRASTPVVRFKNPLDGAVVVDDLVHGSVAFQNTELDDLIIARSDGTPTYNFCVVVDDMDMSITHVIRGDDHLNNTPRQMNMLRALGADAAGVRARADDPRRRRREAVQAPRRGERAAVPRGGLPARGAAQLPRAPRLVARRPGDLHARGDDRSCSTSATSTRPPPRSIRRSCCGSTSST